MTRIYLTTVLAVVLLLTGCGTSGMLYTHVTTPLDTNMSQTPTGVNDAKGDIKHITVYDISVLWGSNAIGDIAKENGMETVYYADIEEFDVLGIWKQHIVHIYGK